MQEEMDQLLPEQNEGSDELYERFTLTIDKGQEPLHGPFPARRPEPYPLLPWTHRMSAPFPEPSCWLAHRVSYGGTDAMGAWFTTPTTCTCSSAGAVN